MGIIVAQVRGKPGLLGGTVVHLIRPYQDRWLLKANGSSSTYKPDLYDFSSGAVDGQYCPTPLLGLGCHLPTMGLQVVRQGRRLIHQQTAQQALTAGREQL